MAVKRGQVLTSYRQIEDSTGVGVQVIRTLIKLLEAERAINTDTSNGRMLVTICNYEKYQSGPKDPNPEANTELTQSQHTKETKKQIPPSEGAIAPVDQGIDLSSPTTAAWGVGKAYFARLGIKDPGGMVGKFLKVATPVEFLAAIQAADRARTEDPIPYITEALKQKGRTSVRSQWRRGEMRVLSSGRVQEFDGHAWDFRNDLTAADVEAAHA